MPIDVTIPNIKFLLQNLAVSTAIGKTFKDGKPLPVILPEVAKSNPDEWLGVPALTELQFRYNGKEYVLNDCVMVVSLEKDMERTKLKGRNGTVKEYMSDGDYIIEVQASISGDGLTSGGQNFNAGKDAYPVEELKSFINVLKAQETLDVYSEWLEIFGIKSVVIASKSVPQETFSNMQTLSFTMYSDEPYEIKLLKDA